MVSYVNDDLVVTGDMSVQGKTSMSGNYIYMNNGYTTAVAVTTGFMFNYEPTGLSDSVNGSYTAGVASTSNPTVVTTGTATFAVGDFIQISGSRKNNGLYEVLSHSGTTLTIRGVGTTATQEDFTDNQFTAFASDSATISKVNVTIARAGVDGVFEVARGSNSPSGTPLTFKDIFPNQVDTISYAASINLDFDPLGITYKSVTLTGNITFTTSNRGAGRTLLVRIVGDGSDRTLSFPAGWTFMGGPAPSALPANAVGLLSLTAYGTADTDVVAGFTYETTETPVGGAGTANELAYFTDPDSIASMSGVTWNGSSRLDIGIDGTTSAPALTMGSTDAPGTGIFKVSTNIMGFSSASAEMMRLTNVGMVFNENAGGNGNVRMESSSQTHLFYLDATNSGIGVGQSTPTSQLEIGGTYAPAASAIGSMLSVGGTLTEAGSGTHALLAGVEINAPTITGAAATVTDTASLYVSGAPSATVTGDNYAMWIDSGHSRFDGYLLLEEIAAPGIPLSGFGALYAKTDGYLYWQDDVGVEYNLASGTGGGGDVTKVGTPVDNQIGVWTGDGTIEGDANFTWDGYRLEINPDGGAAQTTVLIIKNDTTVDQDVNMTADIDFHLWDNNTRLSIPQARIGIVGDSTAAQASEAGGRLAFYTATEAYPSPVLTERMRITPDGKVGIGTPSPSNVLQVTGGTLATGVRAFSTDGTLATGAAQYGARFNFTPSSTTGEQRALLTTLNLGAATNAGGSSAIEGINSASSQGTVALVGAQTETANMGLYGFSSNDNGTSKVGVSVGVMGYARWSTTRNYGVVGRAVGGTASDAIGVYGTATQTVASDNLVGGMFTLYGETDSIGTLTDAALIVDNGAQAAPIFLGRDNGTTVFTIADGGALTQNGGAVFNETGVDVDFRVETSGITNAISVDGGNDTVTLGTNIIYLGINGTASYSTSTTTTDATVTTIATWGTSSNQTYLVRTKIIGKRTGGAAGSANDGATYIRTARVKNNAGTVTIHNLQTDFTSEDQNWDGTIAVSGTNILVRVTGATNNNISWVATTTIEAV